MQTFLSATTNRICDKGCLKQDVHCLTSMHIFCWDSYGRPAQVFGLSDGYWLAISKINTLPDIVIYYHVPKWHMAASAINTLEYCVHKIFWLLAGYWLAIGWLCPKAIHFKTKSYTTMYQSGTWLRSIFWTVVHSLWICSSDGYPK